MFALPRSFFTRKPVATKPPETNSGAAADVDEEVENKKDAKVEAKLIERYLFSLVIS